MLSKHIVDGLMTFMLLDQRWYISMIFSSDAVLNSMNSPPKVNVCTDLYVFEYQVVGVDPTTERRPGIEPPVTLSCP